MGRFCTDWIRIKGDLAPYCTMDSFIEKLLILTFFQSILRFQRSVCKRFRLGKFLTFFFFLKKLNFRIKCRVVQFFQGSPKSQMGERPRVFYKASLEGRIESHVMKYELFQERFLLFFKLEAIFLVREILLLFQPV